MKSKLVRDLESGDYILHEGLVLSVLTAEESGKFMSSEGRLTLRMILRDWPLGSSTTWKGPSDEVTVLTTSDEKYEEVLETLINDNVAAQSDLRSCLDFLHLSRRRFREQFTSPPEDDRMSSPKGDCNG